MPCFPPASPWSLGTAQYSRYHGAAHTAWAGRVAEGAWVGVTCAAKTAEHCMQSEAQGRCILNPWELAVCGAH